MAIDKLSYLLAFSIYLANNVSQAYIFITLIPLIISFIRLILSSVFLAVSPRSVQNCLLIHPIENSTSMLLSDMFNEDNYLLYMGHKLYWTYLVAEQRLE